MIAHRPRSCPWPSLRPVSGSGTSSSHVRAAALRWICASSWARTAGARWCSNCACRPQFASGEARPRTRSLLHQRRVGGRLLRQHGHRPHSLLHQRREGGRLLGSTATDPIRCCTNGEKKEDFLRTLFELSPNQSTNRPVAVTEPLLQTPLLAVDAPDPLESLSGRKVCALDDAKIICKG